MSSPATYPPFNPVDTATPNLPPKDEVESPSISSTNALARFEFEAGHGREGTKILMVEWEDDDTTRGIRGDWHISWEGKTTVLPADDQPSNDINRIYFLLPPGVAVPSSVTLTHRPRDGDKSAVVWHTNPLPAIFPPELGASARAVGKKGILHTIWAKKRLQVLQKEIEAESKNNVEGIGFLMAVQEKEWIEQTFGVTAKPISLSISLAEPTVASLGPASPKSPGGGRLMEKLRGLKLGTSEKDLSAKSELGEPPQSNPLSPESSDVAVSSFATFKGASPSVLAAKPPQPPQNTQTTRRVAAHGPPPSVVEQQHSGMASLNALAFQSRGPPLPEDDNDEGLFAMPISPRSPEMGKSPFSFGGNETAKYLQDRTHSSLLIWGRQASFRRLSQGRLACQGALAALLAFRTFQTPSPYLRQPRPHPPQLLIVAHANATTVPRPIRSDALPLFLLHARATTLQHVFEAVMSERPGPRRAIQRVHYTGEEAAADINDKLAALKENEDEFDRWEALVKHAMNLEGGVNRNSSPSAIELVRQLFDTFLDKFPLLFGYWKMYADLEFSIGGTETAEMVYERGVSCVPLSVDLWTNYCAFKLDTCHDNDVIRDLFERGVQFVGLEFQSHPFWDKYTEFEERIQNIPNVTKLYARISPMPLYQFSRYYEKFRPLIFTRPIGELADSKTIELCTEAVRSENEILPKSALEQERALRDKIDAYYANIYSNVATEVAQRWAFEERLKRPYFTVTEMEADELAAWRNYLDWEEKRGDFQRTRFLYERCLVACALYDEFWLRFARWMFAQAKEEDARLIYMRASCVCVPIADVEIRLHWARFEEKLDRIQVAHDIHLAILQEVPNHVETIISMAGLKRRHEGNDAAVKILEEYIQQRDADVGGFLAVEQARILWRCKDAAAETRKLFLDKHQHFADSQIFWIKFMEFEIGQPSYDPEEVHARVKAVHNLLRGKGRFASQDMTGISHYYMQYLLEHGGKDAADEYMQLDKEVNGKDTETRLCQKSTLVSKAA
ncbi:hypothetical protein BDV95DRAFT_624512 [Massariosphaeria phaeospora]|uniref:Uncharacterized protein n=1 Tax=Massariosphaeria phaeospora TaxID=100035 RepID=A0A7C8MY42_9PLEO|nr:hypothetical protein BDV95DRAFT_624512 [Massariosphaeria phaeospora]